MIAEAAARARAAVRRLRAGIVPEWEIEELSGAFGSLGRISEGSLTSLRTGERTKPLLVRGEWGTGKTHLLSYVRAAAARAGIANASVVLNARNAALNYPQRLYPTIAESLKVGNERGLKSLLTAALRNPEQRLALERDLADHSYRGALLQLLHATGEDAFHDVDEHPAWTNLLGGDIATMDYGHKRTQAIGRLQALSLILRTIGYGGLVLLFDEAETIDQLWNVRSRVAAYDVIGCLCRVAAIWCVFGVTGRFDHTIRLDLDNGILANPSVGAPAAWFLKAWKTDEFATARPPAMDREIATQVAVSIVRIYELAYGKCAEGISKRCVDDWSANPARNPRRLIRLLIHRLDLQRPPNCTRL